MVMSKVVICRVADNISTLATLIDDISRVKDFFGEDIDTLQQLQEKWLTKLSLETRRSRDAG